MPWSDKFVCPTGQGVGTSRAANRVISAPQVAPEKAEAMCTMAFAPFVAAVLTVALCAALLARPAWTG